MTQSAQNVETTVLGADEIILNMGPQHPSTHGVLRVKLKLDGERVVGLGMHHRLSASRRGKDRRASHLPAIRAVRGPHGLRRGGFERPGLLRGGRKIAGRGSAAARARGAHDSDGAAAHRQPPGVARNACARYRRADSGFLLFSRARRNSENFREVLRRAADHACVPHRRLAIRDVRRLRRGSEALLRRFRAAHRRIRNAAHRESHLGGPHEGRRHPDRRGCHRAWRHRAGAARQRREVGYSQSGALRRLRSI